MRQVVELVLSAINQCDGSFTDAERDLITAKLRSKSTEATPTLGRLDQLGSLKPKASREVPVEGIKAVKISAKQRLSRRQSAMLGSSNPAQQKALTEDMGEPEIKKTGLGNATKEQCAEAGQQLVAVIRNSGGDVVGDVKGWVAKSFPTGNMSKEEKDNFAEVLAVVGKELRTASKMARIGVALKIFLTLVLGYVDVVTDFLVAQSYYDAGEVGTAQATAGFAILAIVIQAMFTFFQYAKKPWKEQGGRTLAALLGLGPLLEGLSVWTGKEDSDLLLSGPKMYAFMKAVEIAFESIPESIIQLLGLLKAKVGEIQTIQIIGIISSIVSGAFIMTGKNCAKSEATS